MCLYIWIYLCLSAYIHCIFCISRFYTMYASDPDTAIKPGEPMRAQYSPTNPTLEVWTTLWLSTPFMTLWCQLYKNVGNCWLNPSTDFPAIRVRNGLTTIPHKQFYVVLNSQWRCCVPKGKSDIPSSKMQKWALHHQSKLLFRREAKPFSPLMR